MTSRSLTALAFVICLLLSTGYTVPLSVQAAGTLPIGEPVRVQVSLGLSPVHVSSDNPATAETSSLGVRFDDDKIFSQELENLVALLKSPAGEILPGAGALG